MLTFDRLLFHHFVQEVNQICYLRSLIVAHPGYQISLTSCTKWQNDERWAIDKIILKESIPFWKLGPHVIIILSLTLCVVTRGDVGQWIPTCNRIKYFKGVDSPSFHSSIKCCYYHHWKISVCFIIVHVCHQYTYFLLNLWRPY